MIRSVLRREGTRYIRTTQHSVIGFLSSNLHYHAPHKRFTTATSTDWDARFQQLEAESRSLKSNATPVQLETAISQWESLLEATNGGSRYDDDPKALLEPMKTLYQKWKTTSRSNETDSPYKSMLHVASKVSGREALTVLQDWEVVAGNIELAIPDTCFDAVIRAYATTTGADAAEEAKSVALEFIQHMEQSYTLSSSLPNAWTYQHVVRCICRAIQDNPADAAAVKPLLENMDKFIQKIDPTQITTDQQHFNALAGALHDALEAYALLLDVHGTIEEPTARAHAQEWRMFWLQLLDPSCKGLWMSVPNCIAALEQTVMAILRIHQLELKTIAEVAQDVGAGESCTQIVLGIETMMGTTVKILPSGRHYLRAVQTWSILRDKFAIVVEQQHALLLQRMRDQHFRYHAWPETEEDHLTATQSWNNLLRANLDANLPKTTEELWDLNASRSTEYRRIRRNQESFTILLQALAVKRADSEHDARRRAQRAHQILHKTLLIEKDKRIFQPTAENYASVMVAWQRSYHKDAALRCQEVFDHLLAEASLSEEMEPTKHHYNALLITWGFSKHPEATQRVMDVLDTLHTRGVQIPNETYSAVLFSLSRSRSKEGVDRIDQILQQLEEIAAVDPSSEVLSTACYNSLMYAQCHSNDPEIAALCEDTFRRHWDSYVQSGFPIRLQPNSTTYATRIDAIANSSHADSIRAVSLLDEMEKLAAEESAEAPGRAVYTAVMKAALKDETVGPERVQAILDRMQAAYEAGNEGAKPDAHSWTILLQSWAKSKSQNKASVVWELVESMKKKYRQGDLTMKPTPYTYSAVLNACAFTDTRDETEKFEAVRVAVTALKELGEIESGLSQYAFRNMLQVICRQIGSPTEREKLAGRVFQRCCQEGFVESGVVRILRNHLPHLYKRLPSNDDGVVIPGEWRRRVPHETAVGT